MIDCWTESAADAVPEIARTNESETIHGVAVVASFGYENPSPRQRVRLYDGDGLDGRDLDVVAVDCDGCYFPDWDRRI